MDPHMVKISEINVENRARKDYGDIDALATSIKRVGLINAIVVEKRADGELYLLAGERRLRACKEVGMAEVPIKMLEELTEQERLEIELEENLGRKDFAWGEEVELKLKIYEREQGIQGVAVSGPGNKGFSMRDLALLLNESVGTVHNDITLAKAIRVDPELAKKCKTKTEAIKHIRKQFVAKVGQATGEVLKTSEAAGTSGKKSTEDVEATRENKLTSLNNWYNVGDAYEGLGEITGVFDVMNIDPPYGIDYVNKRRSRDDKADHYVEIPEDEYLEKMKSLAKLSFNACSGHAFAFLWHAPIFTGDLVTIFRDAGWAVNPVPCVWVKLSPGQCRQPARWFSNNTEFFLMMVKGRPAIKDDFQGKPNVFQHPTTPHQTRIHPTEKPVSLLKDIYKRVAYPKSTLCAPFLGSGNDIIAATELNLVCMGWDLSEEHKNKAIGRLVVK